MTTTKEGFRNLYPRTWDETVDQLSGFPEGWIFRGQRDSEWNPETSLRRAAGNSDARFAELQVIRDFKRQAHLYVPAQQIPQDELEWLALMQHFGAPTRLLDCSHSPYVAAYFALEDASQKGGACAVWAFDTAWWSRRSTHLVRKNLPTHPFALLQPPQDILANEPWFSQLVLASEVDLILPVVPERLSERLSAQQGLFMCQGNVRNSFIGNALAGGHPDEKNAIVKITLQTSVRDDALESLRKMNVQRAALFPGLDGFGQSLRYGLVRRPLNLAALQSAIKGFTVEPLMPPEAE